MKIENTKGKSPYSKYQKTPYVYSPSYQRWTAALGDSGAGFGTPDYFAADEAFRRTHDLPLAAQDYGEVYTDA